MARFRSAVQRNLWFGFGISVVTDALAAYLVAFLLTGDSGPALLWMALILGGAYLFQLAYGILSVARYAALFFLFEKNGRIAETIAQMNLAKMPPPDGFYINPEEYLMKVIQTDDATPEAKLFAGTMIGGINTLRNTNHGFMAMCASMVLEEAIEKYGLQFGRVHGLSMVHE